MDGVIEIKSRRFFKAGYEVRTEIVDDNAGGTLEMKNAYNVHGEWIGEPKFAYRLIVTRGILPEKVNKNRNICSIGYCPRDGRWYGWSHRAIVGFKIGDMIFEEEFGDDDTLFIRHGKKKIKTHADARLSAIRFADYVS